MPGLRISDSDDTIDLRVIACTLGEEVVFKLRKHTQLQRLIEAFHAHRRQPAGTFILFYNSQEVNSADTPESLRMLRRDCLQAVPNPALTSFLRVRRATNPESYYITVLDMELSRAEYLFRMRNTTRMEKLMETYCARVGSDMEEREFYFDSIRIVPEDTAESLGMNRPGFAYLVISRPVYDNVEMTDNEER